MTPRRLSTPAAAAHRRDVAEYNRLLDELVDRLERESERIGEVADTLTLAEAYGIDGAPRRAALSLARSRS